MNITLIVDNLGSGGAERQCSTLAIALKKKGHNVVILGYSKGDHFLNEIRNCSIDYYLVEGRNPLIRMLRFRKKIKHLKPDSLIAFMQTPSVLAELASFPFKKWKLIVSERTNLSYLNNLKTKIHLQFHRLADLVTTNSNSNAKVIIENAPYLKRKLITVYNGLDLEKFSPLDLYLPNKRKVLIVAASHQSLKNARNLIFALKKLKDSKFTQLPFIYWYGSDLSHYIGKPCDTYLATRNLIYETNLQQDFILKDPVIDIHNIYQKADALILPSFYEGLPNSVCEAMACGLPILMSNISDINVLTEGNGIHFNPYSIDSIADAMRWFCNLDNNELIKLRNTSRKKAEYYFSLNKMVEEYLKLIESC